VKRVLLLLIGIMILLIVWWSSGGSSAFFRGSESSADKRQPSLHQPAVSIVDDASDRTQMPVAAESLQLLDPQSNVREDLALIQQLLQEYRRNLGGNPIGENDEVTAALSGQNGKKLAYLADEVKRLIDARGCLLDRWGNPYVFHAMSGTIMEIRSLGPDGIPYNADDQVSE
jgi:hypothetical protein